MALMTKAERSEAIKKAWRKRKKAAKAGVSKPAVKKAATKRSAKKK